LPLASETKIPPEQRAATQAYLEKMSETEDKRRIDILHGK
jgi:hypothetical protein